MVQQFRKTVGVILQPDTYEQVVLDAIDYFTVNGGGTTLNGGITFFSAGNYNNSGSYYPAYYSETIAVSATNNKDKKSNYSNYGSWISYFSPRR